MIHKLLLTFIIIAGGQSLGCIAEVVVVYHILYIMYRVTRAVMT